MLPRIAVVAAETRRLGEQQIRAGEPPAARRGSDAHGAETDGCLRPR